MKRRFMLLSASLLWIVPSVFAQLPPLGPPQKPTAEAAAAPAGSLSVDAANADLKIARAANQEKRYADAEALMLKDTAARPGLPYLWIELGQAQLSQKKYTEAEASFKAALSGGESAQKAAPTGGFYVAGKGTAAHSSISSAAPPPVGKNNHEVEGLAHSSLGEVYIRTNRTAEAQAAFDQAVKDNPTQAALYLRNETIFFLQIGNAAAQVEAANKAIAIDPGRAALYFYKGQGLAAQATIDPKTQKLVLPAGCAEALQKYLDMEPAGPYATDAKGMLAAAGVAIKAGKK
jgi:tetratricopeptide (TPR) repeat protein